MQTPSRMIDFYRRPLREFTESTMVGVVMSVCAIVFMALLFLVELSAFLSTEMDTQIYLDTKGEDGMIRVNFNLTLLDLECEYVTVDMLDIMGTNKMDISSNIHKWSIDNLGLKKVFQGRNMEQRDILHDSDEHRPLEEAHRDGVHAKPVTTADFDTFILKNDYTVVDFFAPWCVWCQRLAPTWEAFAERMESEASNVKVVTVDCVAEAELCAKHKIQAYPTVRFFSAKSGAEHGVGDFHKDRTVDAFKSWVESLAEDLKHDNVLDRPENIKVKTGSKFPGCIVTGSIRVKRVPGNFHIEPRSKHHNFDPRNTNLSHIVNSLEVGTPLPTGITKQVERVASDEFLRFDPLKGNVYVNYKRHQAYHHHIKVVPTDIEIQGTWRGKNEVRVYNLLSESQINNYDQEDVPEARFSYDFSPMAVNVSKKGKEWYEFVTSLCAIIGGTFTILGLIDAVLVKVFKPKKL
mmetsp:Transcript_8601/g.32345  ORF Transcript_8601/g.32345 Transcript_8601/m.32345 type:complete len:463 (-) Transcript_8601:683-2071(-)